MGIGELLSMPRLAIGVMILDHSEDMPKVLLGLRCEEGSPGYGEWSLPGGKVDWLENENRPETPEETALREVTEETGLHIKNLCKVTFTHDYFGKNGNYITAYYTAAIDKDKCDGVPEVIEPNKTKDWKFFPIDNLPHPLFSGVEEAIRQWDWSREISWVEAMMTGGKEVATPYFEPLIRLKNHCGSLSLKRGPNGLRLRKNILGAFSWRRKNRK